MEHINNENSILNLRPSVIQLDGSNRVTENGTIVYDRRYLKACTMGIRLKKAMVIRITDLDLGGETYIILRKCIIVFLVIRTILYIQANADISIIYT